MGPWVSAHTLDKLDQRHQRWQNLPCSEDLSGHSHYLPLAAGAILNCINELKTEHHTSRLIHPGSFSFGWENRTDIRSGTVLCITAEGPIPFLRQCGRALGEVEAYSVTKFVAGTSP